MSQRLAEISPENRERRCIACEGMQLVEDTLLIPPAELR